MKHENSGQCGKCRAIFDVYAGFDRLLRTWFETLQATHPDAHISCAGRGKVEQELLFQRGATRATWGRSAHNWNAAIDIFRLLDGRYDLSSDWFWSTVEPVLLADFTWYGRAGSIFFELPHIELTHWREFAKAGTIKLVE